MRLVLLADCSGWVEEKGKAGVESVSMDREEASNDNQEAGRNVPK